MCDQTPFLQGRSRFNIRACAMHVTSACTAIHFKTVQMITPRQYVIIPLLICARQLVHARTDMRFSCVYRTQWWSPIHNNTMPGILHTAVVTCSPCQEYCTQRRSPVHSNTIPGIPHTVAVTYTQ